MAGIYLHIPFCKQRCTYCNFHFSTQTKQTEQFLAALTIEIQAQKSYLAKQKIETVYFGGGTPSLLSLAQVEEIMSALELAFQFNRKELAECSFEVNPDDMSEEYLNGLKKIGINRLSIGIQSFKEKDLKLMNRAHSMNQSHNAIALAYRTGFASCSIDLIYGTPNLSNEEWRQHILQAIEHKVPHISAYALTVEPKTALASAIDRKQLPPLEEQKAAEQFEILVATLIEQGYEQYEISNFALPGKYALHNTNYWKQKHYIGLGPSAHSFNGHSRQWNIANNALYIQSLNKDGKANCEVELLSKADQYNEYIMTSLRTQWGINLSYLEKQFPEYFKESFDVIHSLYLQKNQAILTDNHFKLTNKGKLFADQIASDFFISNT